MNLDMPIDYSIKILLVDDEVNITRSLRRILAENEQYELLIANSGEDGLVEVQENPDLGIIISDQRMPGMSGVDFLGKAREKVPDAIRILLTGYADIEASIGAINKGGVFRYLTKPWDDDELLQVVAEAARSFWLVNENRRLNALVSRQNEELQSWNARLKQRVLDQTAQIRSKNEALAENNYQLKNSFNKMIEAFSGLVEMRDSISSGHSKNVAEIVSAMIGRMDLSKKETDTIYSAALLHDIGKIGMSDSLLGKQTCQMCAAEMKEYQKHSVRGQAALDMVPGFRDIGLLIRHHHESFNGFGFPDRLKGDHIPLGSRLLLAADILERKLATFPESVALDKSLEALKPEWGTRLDPSLKMILELSAREIYSHLQISNEVTETRVSTRELKVGMRLRHDLYTGTGVLLLKQGAIFDEHAIEAVRRCQTIDPFEKEIAVLIARDDS